MDAFLQPDGSRLLFSQRASANPSSYTIITPPPSFSISNFQLHLDLLQGKESSKMASRLSQLNAHLNFPRGLLAGQVAIITGAGQGIGAEAARLFANEGAKVVVADIDSGA